MIKDRIFRSLNFASCTCIFEDFSDKATKLRSFGTGVGVNGSHKCCSQAIVLVVELVNERLGINKTGFVFVARIGTG